MIIGEHAQTVSPPPDQHTTTPPPLTPDMADATTPSTTNPETPELLHSTTAVRRNRTPPRASDGGYVCDFDGCKTRPVFTRLCEWNKHMDRHERPYVCGEPGCDTREGFTYSGGLLRHQREVHKKHLTKKDPLYCPYPDCPRASGEGFTRKENLAEHKRRRHSQLSVSSTFSIAPSISANGAVQPYANHFQSHQIESRKRKRPITPQDEDEQEDKYEVQPFGDISSHPYVKQLKQIIQHQRDEITRLQNFLGSVPTNAYYAVGSNMMSQVQGGSPSIV
jgi:hypothetical protein